MAFGTTKIVLGGERKQIFTVTEETWEVVPSTLDFYGFYLDNGSVQIGDISPLTFKGYVIEIAGYFSTGSFVFGLRGDHTSNPADYLFASLLPEGGTELLVSARDDFSYDSPSDTTSWTWLTAAEWDGTGTSTLIIR